MGLHKDLTGTDIHETKVTLLNGSPIALNTVASAAGIAAIDTSVTPNQMYRANSTTPGDWQAVGGAGGGSNPYAGSGAFVQANMFQVHNDNGGGLGPNTGMATNGIDRIYIVNDQQYKIQVWDLNGNKLTDYTLPSPSGGYTDIMYAGSYLWVIDSAVLRKIDPSNGNIIGSYSPNASGGFYRLTNNGTYIFISSTQNGNSTIHKFDPSNNTFARPYNIDESVIVDSVASDGGNTLWEATRSSAIIRRVSRDPQWAKIGIYGLVFRAKNDGISGNSITVQFAAGPSPSTPSISVVGQAITITIDNGNTNERAIMKAVNADASASALVVCTSTTPTANHNYGIYFGPQSLSGGVDHLLGTIDVSASGLPVNVLYWAGFVWATMNNGNLLKIDPGTGSVLGTYPSGQSALAGITGDSYFIYVTSTAPSNKILAFDFTTNSFVDVIAPGVTPDDIVWDGGTNLWVITRTSAAIKRLNRTTGSLLGTATVASGLPRRGIYLNGALYVVTSVGDILKINPTTDAIDGTYTSGAVGLDSISPWNGTTLYVGDVSGSRVFPFNVNLGTFGTPFSVTGIAAPNDIMYDGGATLWLLDFTSATIKRVDTSGNFQGNVNLSVLANPGAMPRRMGPTLFNGNLWVTMSSGKVLRCDPYGIYGVLQVMSIGSPDLTGITNAGGVDFYMSATGGTNGIVRFVWDGSEWFGRMVQSEGITSTAIQLKISGQRFITIDGTSTIMSRWEPNPNGTLVDTADVFPSGTPKDIVSHLNESVIYAVTGSGNVVEVLNGNETFFASVVVQDLIYTATSVAPGRAGNLRSIQYVTGGAPGTVVATGWDGQHLVLQINSGTTTATTIINYVNAGGYPFTAALTGTGIGSNPQATQVQSFLSGGSDTGLALGRVLPSGKSALSAISENSSNGLFGFSGWITAYTSPSNGYLALTNYGSPAFGFYALGAFWPGGQPQNMVVNGNDLWVGDSSFSFAPSRVDITTMKQVDFVMGTDDSSYSVVFIGGYAYFDSNSYPNLYKVDPATNNSIKTLVLGSQTGGNYYSWGAGLFSDGSSIWYLGIDSPSTDNHMFIERLDSTGKSFASLWDFDRADIGYAGYRMLRVGNFLFARISYHLVKFNVNLG